MARHDTNGNSVLAPNDPYNDMEGANIRPDFGITNSSNKPPKSTDSSKTNQSKDLLRNSESSAISKKEPAFESSWKNNVSGKSLTKNLTGKGKGKFSKKKSGIAAMMVIISLLVGGGAFLGSSHSLLAPAMESLMTEATDTQHASFVRRVTHLTTYHGSNSKTFTAIPDSVQTKTKQGRVATFFDKSADKLYRKLGISRNIFSGYQQTGNSDADMEKFRNTMEPEYDNNTSAVRNAYEEEVDILYEDGNPTGDKTLEQRNPTDLDGRSNSSMPEAEQKAKSFLESTASSAQKAAKAASIANAACTAMRVGATISAVVAANEIYQSINYFMNYMENVSKMKYGEGSNSAINEVLNTLTTPVDGTFPDINSSDGAAKTITGAPVQANGMQMMLAYAPVDSNTNKNFSIERTMSAVAKALNMNATSVYTCAGIQAGAAVVSIITTISTFGVSAIGQVLLDVAIQAGTGIAIAATLSFIVPTIAKTLFTNIFETTTGIPAGELLARGSSAANTRVGRTGSGQSPSSDSVALAYNKITQEVIAQEAEADRANRSPFDITSKNTFLGSIAYQLLPITLLSAKGSTAAITNINTLTRTTSSAIASLTNSASAASSNSYMSQFGDCSNLKEIGAVGDIYCNPITTTDPSTIELDPANEDYVNAIDSQVDHCDSDGYCEVKEDSNLARYINYCANRDSPFGIVDANILGNLEKGNSFLGAIPIVGDILDILNSTTSGENLLWATGERCGNTDKNSTFWNSEGKYYQRYIEDQRIFAWSGAYGDKASPVVAYEEKYEQEHPLDNSPAGYLARISGITKEDAETVIAIAEYYNFLEEYNPDTRLSMGEKTIAKTSTEIITNFNEISPNNYKPKNTTYISHNQHILYNDIRNRNYAA